MTKLPRVILPLLCALAAACVDDDGDDDGASASGTTGADGSSGTLDDSTGADVECVGSARDLIAADPMVLSNLSRVSDGLVVLVTDPSFATPRTIDRIATVDGTRTTLHTSTGQRQVISLVTLGDDVYFLERNEEIVPRDELFRVPATGGAAEAVGAASFEAARLFAADDAHVYVLRSTSTPVGSVFERVDAATGTVTTIAATPDGSGIPAHVQLAGDDIFFVMGKTGAAANDPLEVFTLRKDATDDTPTSLWAIDVDEDPCMIPLGGMLATPTKLACGFYGMATRNRDGTAPETLIETDFLGAQHVLVASDVENLYVVGLTNNTEHDQRMSRLTTSDATLTPLVCDLGKVGNELADGIFPIQIEYEMVVGATEVFWLEESFDGSALQYRVRAAAK